MEEDINRGALVRALEEDSARDEVAHLAAPGRRIAVAVGVVAVDGEDAGFDGEGTAVNMEGLGLEGLATLLGVEVHRLLPDGGVVAVVPGESAASVNDLRNLDVALQDLDAVFLSCLEDVCPDFTGGGVVHGWVWALLEVDSAECPGCSVGMLTVKGGHGSAHGDEGQEGAGEGRDMDERHGERHGAGKGGQV